MTKFLMAGAASAFVLVGTSALAAPKAEPVRLDEAQMDAVSAGLDLNLNIAVAVPTQVVVPTSVAIATGDNATAKAINYVVAVQTTKIRQRNRS